MSENQHVPISRRRFVKAAGAAAGAAVVGAGVDRLRAGQATGELPKRTLGKTGLKVTTMTLGTAPFGNARDVPMEECEQIINEAIDLGINFLDSSPIYGKAEQALGRALGKRRKDIILTSKVWADTVDEAEEKFASSLKTLNTDYVDVLYYHSLGQRKIDGAMNADGVFTWLLKQKKAGKCRFAGISAHNIPTRFAPFLETDEVDVILVAVNYVDRHTYDFESKVLPLARKHNAGIVAMKVFGAPDQKTGSWMTRKAKPMVGVDKVELAIRYALSLPGVATANLGVHTAEQLRENVEFVRRFKPLSKDEEAMLADLGKKLAPEWGEHFGPVV